MATRPPAKGNKTMRTIPLNSNAPKGTGGGNTGTTGNSNIPGLTKTTIGKGRMPKSDKPGC